MCGCVFCVTVCIDCYYAAIHCHDKRWKIRATRCYKVGSKRARRLYTPCHYDNCNEIQYDADGDEIHHAHTYAIERIHISARCVCECVRMSHSHTYRRHAYASTHAHAHTCTHMTLRAVIAQSIVTPHCKLCSRNAHTF